MDSEIVNVRVHYDNGHIAFCDYGADLSNFAYMDTTVTNPIQLRHGDLLSWLYGLLSVNPVQQKLKVSGMVPRQRENGWKWELYVMRNSKCWRAFVHMALYGPCKFNLVLLVETEMVNTMVGESSTINENVVFDGSKNIAESTMLEQNIVVDHTESQHTQHDNDEEFLGPMNVDQGEDDEALVDAMELDDDEYLAFVDGRDGRRFDDEDNVPEEWTNVDLDGLTVNDGHSANWDYSAVQVTKGQLFHDKKHLQHAVKKWAFSEKKPFRVVISNSTTYDVKCLAPGCPWRVHGYLPKGETNFVASIVVQHSCRLTGSVLKHRNMTAEFVANAMYGEIVKKTSMSPFQIMLAIQNRYTYDITYDMAWRAKQKALEMRFGTYKDSYHHLPHLLALLQARNPRTIIDIDDYINASGQRILRRAFWSFGCMIEAFKHCRPVLCVDGTFLTGQYKGQLLTCIGADADGKVVPIAFAFVESENKDSWLWFLSLVKMAVVCERPNVCVLHDRHAGILSAVKELQQDNNLQAYWPDLHSRWCMRHLGANFYSQFKSKRLMDLFKKLCKQNRKDKFDEIWELLDKLTSAHMKDVRSKPVVDHEEEPVGLDPIPNEPRQVTRKRKGGRSVKCFSDWIKNEPLDKWSLIGDTDGSRYGIMTTNLAEVYNWVLKSSRSLPLVAIVECILRGTTQYVRDRYHNACQVVQDPQMVYCNKMTEIIEKISAKAQLHRHHQGNQDFVFEVTIREKGNQGMSDSEKTLECQLWPEQDICECNCNKPKLLHIPCSHVYAARAKVGFAATFVSPYYLKEAVQATWSGELRGWRALADFTKPPSNGPDWLPDPTKLVISAGRRKTRRIRNDMDAAEATGRKKSCLACGGEHNRNDCDSYLTHNQPDGTLARIVPKRNQKNKDVGPSV
ncbi:unnamed protein product [Urochloa humidicola]